MVVYYGLPMPLLLYPIGDTPHNANTWRQTEKLLSDENSSTCAVKESIEANGIFAEIMIWCSFRVPTMLSQFFLQMYSVVELEVEPL